ncbi:protein spinster isoform X2 [Culicoides brevitarsis]|uniref:protein spinster isoform X2 n=1 Tax=Culicoides brevitarsis TaxID=469753 RepID=UPI00307BEE4E
MPQTKYQQVHTEDTDTDSSHSRQSSNGGNANIMESRTATQGAGDAPSAVVPASSLPATYSSQHLISGSSEDVGDKERGVPATLDANPGAVGFMSVPKKHMFTVVVLCFINLINYMDRFTIAGVLEDLQKDFGIDDALGGFLQTAFILSYMIFAPIFGYLGDRYSRRVIMGFGIALWSITTLLGSYMPSFTWFVVFRAFVGIGEASYSTIAPTIISDLFVKDLRSKFLALFYFAIPVGSGLGYIVGSETANALNSWRWALRVTPALGILAVILLFYCSEPERGEAEGSHAMEATSYTEDLKALCKNPSFMFSTGGFTCVAFVAGALAWWGPKYMFLGLKTQPGYENITQNDVSYQFGICAMLAGVLGVPLGSFIAQKKRPTIPNCDPLICAIGLFISSPMVYFGLLLANKGLAWTLFFVFLAQVSLNLTWSLVADIVLYVVVPTRRSTAEAFQILISHAFGDAGSPYLVGVVSDAIKVTLRTLPAGLAIGLQTYAQVQDESFVTSTTVGPISSRPNDTDAVKFKSLQYALFITCFVEILGAIFFLITASYILRDKSRAERAVQGQISSIQLTESVSDNSNNASPVHFSSSSASQHHHYNHQRHQNL